MVTVRDLQLRLLAVARQVIGVTAADTHRRIVRRVCSMTPRQRAQRAPRPRRGPAPAPSVGRQLAVEVVGRRRAPKTITGAVCLLVAQVVLDHPRRAPQEHRQHPGRERIERATVADTSHAGQPADDGHDVVRGRPDGLVHDEDAVELGRSRSAVGHRRRLASGRR